MQEEIFRTKNASIAQCSLSNSFFLSYENEEIAFSLCDLYSFKKKIMNLNLMDLLETDAPDLEIVYLPHCDRFLMLNLHQILQFRELLNGTFDILALNSSIQKILRRNVFNF
ncbi:MAG: hypothetical protein RLO81_18855 [Fulvivirga sp.]|uniref:hypothetical protein n=1 Tax=Fulvivirga sp. TaxID=1931237 RepID=UPI0032EFCDD3